MRAILLARATAASLRGLRLSSWRSHAVASLLSARDAWRITAVAPATSKLRSRAWPARLTLLAAGRMLARCQPEPSREMSAGLEGRWIHLNGQRQGDDRAN